MNVTPVNRIHDPAYPSRNILDDHPELLAMVPRRWQKNPVVLAALAGIYMIVSGCRHSASAGPKGVSRIAPVFEHGDGRGSYGCKVINPPVFLSEDEAKQVIEQEAKKAGISFTSAGKSATNVTFPMTGKGEALGNTKDESTHPENNSRTIKLEFDGADAKRNISFEYVSQSDSYDWEKYVWASTIHQYDIKKSAQKLRTSLVNVKPTGSYAVFYDPFTRVDRAKYTVHDVSGAYDYEASWNLAEKSSKEISREELRKQVRDFIKWLKAEGVI